MKLRIELVLSHEDKQLLFDLRRHLMAFSDSVTKLDADVKALIAQGSTVVAAAVAAKDAQDAAAVDAIDAQVVAALPPAPAPAPSA